MFLEEVLEFQISSLRMRYILLFVKAKILQVRLMNNVLSDFYKASGLKVNYDKSWAMWSIQGLWVEERRQEYPSCPHQPV